MNTRYDRFLSINATRVLHILFEIIVLIHHLRPTVSPLDEQINFALGPIAVGGFLLLSGYGIGVRMREDRETYTRKLLLRRAPVMYARLFLTDLFYLIPFFMMGGHFASTLSGVASVFYLPFLPQFVALSHWVYFIADLMVYYFVFGLLMLLFGKRKNGYRLAVLAHLALLIVLVTVLSVINAQTGSNRYMRAGSLFPIGLALAGCEKDFFEKLRITPALKWTLFSLFVALGVLAFFFSDLNPVAEYVLPIPFALAGMIAFMGYDRGGKGLRYASGLVIGVYLSHEAYFFLLRHFFPELNGYLAMGIVILLAVATAALIDGVKRLIRAGIAHKKTAE